MRVISNKEFNTNQGKYFNLPVNEEVCAKRGNGMYNLRRTLKRQCPEQAILEPDDDLRNAITAEQLLEMLHEDIHQMFNEKR